MLPSVKPSSPAPSTAPGADPSLNRGDSPKSVSVPMGLPKSVSVTALARQEAAVISPPTKGSRRPETSPVPIGAKSLPAMVGASPYDEEHKTKQEISRLRKRVKELEKAARDGSPNGAAPRDYQVAYLQDVQKKQVLEVERRAAELTAAELKRVRQRCDQRVATVERALEFANADRQHLHRQLQTYKAVGYELPAPPPPDPPPPDPPPQAFATPEPEKATRERRASLEKASEERRASREAHAKVDAALASAQEAAEEAAEALRKSLERYAKLEASHAELATAKTTLEKSNTEMHSAVTALTEERDAQAEDLLAAAEREADLNEQVGSTAARHSRSSHPAPLHATYAHHLPCVTLVLLEQVAKAQKGADKLLEKQKALVKEREADQALAMEKRLKEFEGVGRQQRRPPS